MCQGGSIFLGALKEACTHLAPVVWVGALHPVRVPGQHSQQGVGLLDGQRVPQKDYSPVLQALVVRQHHTKKEKGGMMAAREQEGQVTPKTQPCLARTDNNTDQCS